MYTPLKQEHDFQFGGHESVHLYLSFQDRFSNRHDKLEPYIIRSTFKHNVRDLHDPLSFIHDFHDVN